MRTGLIPRQASHREQALVASRMTHPGATGFTRSQIT